MTFSASAPASLRLVTISQETAMFEDPQHPPSTGDSILICALLAMLALYGAAFLIW